MNNQFIISLFARNQNLIIQNIALAWQNNKISVLKFCLDRSSIQLCHESIFFEIRFHTYETICWPLKQKKKGNDDVVLNMIRKIWKIIPIFSKKENNFKRKLLCLRFTRKALAFLKLSGLSSRISWMGMQYQSLIQKIVHYSYFWCHYLTKESIFTNIVLLIRYNKALYFHIDTTWM